MAWPGAAVSGLQTECQHSTGTGEERWFRMTLLLTHWVISETHLLSLGFLFPVDEMKRMVSKQQTANSRLCKLWPTGWTESTYLFFHGPWEMALKKSQKKNTSWHVKILWTFNFQCPYMMLYHKTVTPFHLLIIYSFFHPQWQSWAAVTNHTA